MLIDEVGRQCPRCKKSFLRTELMSYSQFGRSELRSDGRDMSMQSTEMSFLPFLKCPVCKQLIWEEDSPVLTTEEDDFDNLPRADYPSSEYWPDIQEQVRKDATLLLNQKPADARALYLHLFIWRSINDYCYIARKSVKQLKIKQYIKEKRKYNALQEEKRNHIRQILQILPNLQNSDSPQFEDTEAIMLKIELLRENKEFSKAKQLLKKNADKLRSYPKFVKKSKKTLWLRKSSVFMI